MNVDLGDLLCQGFGCISRVDRHRALALSTKNHYEPSWPYRDPLRVTLITSEKEATDQKCCVEGYANSLDDIALHAGRQS